MTEAKIFLVNPTKKELTPMTETTYATEDDLQAFLARYPDLLPGDQIVPENPRRWLLVSREMGVPGEEDGGNRWSLDHLFLDQDGIPTFVECKRSSDTRSRREVVAQMLDYAANGIQYWPISRLRQAALETVDDDQETLDEKIQELLGPEDADNETAIETYWQTVEQNLRAGKVRLIFVADETPRELRRLVEFLNEKMTDVEVLAVEVKQFLGKEDQTVLVPRIIGLTEASRSKKGDGSGKRSRTNRTEFLAKCQSPMDTFFEGVLDLAEEIGHTIYWGEKGFSIRAFLSQEQRLVSFAYGWPSGEFDLHLSYLPIPDEEKLSLRQELMNFGVFDQSSGKILRSPLKEQNLSRVQEVYHFMLDKIDEIVQKY